MATNDVTEDCSVDEEDDLPEEGAKRFCDGPGKMKSLTSNADETFTMDTKTWTILFASSDISMDTLEAWLSKYQPSTWTKGDGIPSRISIVNSHGRKFKAEREDDVEGLLASWETFLKSGRPVNFENIKKLACSHKVLSGKWIFSCSSGGKVDHLWSMVAKGIVGNSGPCYSAKVTCTDRTNIHIVCIYNEDFTDLDQVMLAEQAIRNLRLKCQLLYKPDVFTYLGVYSQNKWKLRPTIMKSNFDLTMGKSVIQSCVSG